MDSFELNKIIGAILGTLLFVMGAGFLAEAVYAPIEGRGPGYELPMPEGDSGEPTPEVAAVPIANLLASADAAAGEGSASTCMGCHNFAEGAGNKAGPELYGVVGRPIGTHAGFTYSDDLAAMGAAGETWTYEHLNAFIMAPHDYAPGTKMNYGGLKNDGQRANLIAYLSTLSASPVPFPPPEAAPAEDVAPPAVDQAAAPADGDASLADSPPEATPVEAPAGEAAPAAAAPAEAPASEAPAAEAAPAETPAALPPATQAPVTSTPPAAAPAQ